MVVAVCVSFFDMWSIHEKPHLKDNVFSPFTVYLSAAGMRSSCS